MNKLIYIPLFAILFSASCNGQTLTQVEGKEDSKLLLALHPKIIKTQGSNQADNIHCGLQDRNGNLWFGSTGEGVYRFDGKLFQQFTVKDGLSSNCVYSMLEDKQGKIWFGTASGICCYDGKTIASVSINFSNQNNMYLNNMVDKNALPNNEVWSMLQDKNGIIWFGTTEGIFCFNGNFFTRFLDNTNIVNSNGLKLKTIQCMYEDDKNNMWFGSGLGQLEGAGFFDGKALTNYKPNGEKWIRTILKDKNGKLLFATRVNGILTYDGKSFTTFDKPPALRNDLLNTIFIDKRNNIWFASDYLNYNDFTNGGLWMFDRKLFVEFTAKNGITNTAVCFMMDDKDGNIWFGTRNNGLYKYDGKTFINYSE